MSMNRTWAISNAGVEFLSRKRFVNRRGIQLDESMEDSVSPVNSQPNLSVARFVPYRVPVPQVSNYGVTEKWASAICGPVAKKRPGCLD
jgi:hypothetical protein